jgi:hypothetical protein
VSLGRLLRLLCMQDPLSRGIHHRKLNRETRRFRVPRGIIPYWGLAVERYADLSRTISHSVPRRVGLLTGYGPQSWKTPVLTSPEQHTECFTCARIYFDEVLHKCPRCGSNAVRHYSTDKLNLFSRHSESYLYDSFSAAALIRGSRVIRLFKKEAA